ncbi:hypothetical protein ANANG_G00025590 [Anguilla anguilla]|uniref:Uncharacterized protein n=1 Tax=Anguilla anguilla TaxID=7936 RepID=A0A9D3S7U3_ANGAN|nr:hypothetical protein ANANG_G00025590 [Anguilla anguilla]
MECKNIDTGLEEAPLPVEKSILSAPDVGPKDEDGEGVKAPRKQTPPQNVTPPRSPRLPQNLTPPRAETPTKSDPAPRAETPTKGESSLRAETPTKRDTPSTPGPSGSPAPKRPAGSCDRSDGQSGVRQERQ